MFFQFWGVLLKISTMVLRFGLDLVFPLCDIYINFMSCMQRTLSMHFSTHRQAVFKSRLGLWRRSHVHLFIGRFMNVCFNVSWISVQGGTVVWAFGQLWGGPERLLHFPPAFGVLVFSLDHAHLWHLSVVMVTNSWWPLLQCLLFCPWLAFWRLSEFQTGIFAVLLMRGAWGLWQTCVRNISSSAVAFYFLIASSDDCFKF